MRLRPALIALTLLITGCTSSVRQAPPPRVNALDPNDMGAAIRPQVDFYRHANAGWLARTSIPADYGRWGSFEKLGLDVLQGLHGLVEDMAKTPAKPGSIEQKVGAFYASAMDTARIEAAGVEPIRPYLDHIQAVHDAASLAGMVAELHQIGAAPLFGFGAGADAKNSTLVIGQLLQGGLGLPERDYYFAKDKQTMREQYVAHVGAMFKLLGRSDAEAAAAAQTVLRMETALADASLTAVARRDPNATYNKRALHDLGDAPAGFAWPAYFAAAGVPDPGPINVENPKFVARIGELSHSAPMRDWQTYLTWHLLNGTANFLSDAYLQQDFSFYGKTLAGKAELSPRWKRSLQACDELIGEAVGQVYVARFFPPEAKQRAADLVALLRETLGERLKALPWMSDATKKHAQEKLAKLHVKIGYPDVWIDYTPLEIGNQPYATNVAKAAHFLFKREMARLNKPVDRQRWEMTPQTVNAYYDPQLNEIVFPAAILQRPFFDADADDAYNFGGIGSVIGHEMTHGYDDQGRQFDADGNMQDWWTPADAEQFKVRASRIVAQFNQYKIFGQPINGELTQGENIADLGGVRLAYAALQTALLRHGTPGPVDGLTPDQRFFLTYAQVWRNQVREQTAQQRLAVDPHSPGEWRVNGPLANLEEFYRVFEVHPGDPMYRADTERVTIW